MVQVFPALFVVSVNYNASLFPCLPIMLMERPLSVQSKTIICLNALSLEEKISGVTFFCVLDKGGFFFFLFFL